MSRVSPRPRLAALVLIASMLLPVAPLHAASPSPAAVPAAQPAAAATTSAAATVTPTPAAVPWDRVSLQFDPGAGTTGPILIITGALPDTAALPATVRFAIPQGATVSWAGEILGGALEDDPTIQPSIGHGADGFDIATLTLTQSRIGQIELQAPGLITRSGELQQIALGWLPSDDTPSVRFAIRVPSGSQIETYTPGAVMEPGPSGSSILSLETSATADQPLGLLVVHTAPAASAAGGASTGGSDTSVFLIFGLLAAAFVAAGIAIARKAKVPGSAEMTGDVSVELDAHVVSPADAGPGASQPISAEDASGGAADELSPDVRQARSGVSPKVIILAVVALVLGVMVIAMTSGEAPGTTKTTGEYAYKVLTDTKADATFTSAVVLSEADPAHEATHVFDSLAAVPGVRSVKLVFAGPSVEVEYSSGTVDEATIAGALTAAGYIR